MADRVDDYARAKAQLRSSTKQEALTRLWAMAREALEVRARLGVKELTYKTDLVPGTKWVEVETDERTVTLRCHVEHNAWAGKGEAAEASGVRTYVLDEAWLLGVATPPD